IGSSPPGAEVSSRPYDETQTPWRPVTRTAEGAVTVRLPRGDYLWRATKPGYREVLGLRSPGRVWFTLDRDDVMPPEMVRVQGGPVVRPWLAFALAFRAMELPAFLIDRHEVTNTEFTQFVQARGYDRPEYWRDLRFVDAHGRPSSWER